jgi:hypothetical protein
MQRVSYRFRRLCALGMATVAMGAVTGSAQAAVTTVGVDPTAPWQGYMNVSELPQNGGTYDFGSAWGTADLQASFAGPVLSLGPNVNIDSGTSASDAYWWQNGGTGAGNHIMDANFYVQNDALAGQTLEFKGNVGPDTFASPYNATAFIKDFNSGYAVVGSAIAQLSNGNFDLTLATNPGDHIQYGFETIGPDTRHSDPAALEGVSVTAAAVPEPATIGLIGALGIPALLRRRRV